MACKCNVTSDWITSKICVGNSFDAINYVTFRWMTCGFIRLATLLFETKLQKCIRMGITILKIFIWSDISSDIRLEIMFYGSARVSP